ncbi:MAG: aspartate-semialdehyde dehydrogenase [Candidatus Melainabacteria bacterium]|nr:MAG: aspartate-semialdehyde dehydrogenase [Candidatus Melainabacteria bacterium]
MSRTGNGKRPVNVAILGATGRVGQELLKVLDERKFPVAKLKPLASARSKDATITFQNKQYPVEQPTPESFREVDIVLASAGAEISKELAPAAVEAGAVVIDNSSAFRMSESVPLVVPEVNGHALRNHHGLIANPNCSTAQLVVVLKPLHELATLKRVIVSTYQSVSGAGKEAMDELAEQTKAVLSEEDYPPSVFQRQIAFNLIPHIDSFLDNGYTKEEDKVIKETRKILELPQLPVTCTAVRVPVAISHSESVLCEFARAISPAEARDALANCPSIEVWDSPTEGIYPTPIDAAGQDPVYVGRIRRDTSSETGLNLWIVADNLRIGAALNAVRIAEYLLEHKLLRQPVPS